MSLVQNWQIDRQMSYWYPESRPRRQFAAVFDINKCIACQTCTLACKTTWTSGKGQEYMLWNNVESKPYGFYPLGWDVKLLEQLGTQQWQGTRYQGRTIFEAAEAGERVLGWRPDDKDYAHPNCGEDDCAGGVTRGAHIQLPHELSWMFYLSFIFIIAFVFLNMMIGIVLQTLQREFERNSLESGEGEAAEVHWIREHTQAIELRLARIEQALTGGVQTSDPGDSRPPR